MTFHQMIVLLVPICSIINCFFSATTTVRIRPLPPGGLRRGVRFNELFYYVESPIALAFPIIFQGKIQMDASSAHLRVAEHVGEDLFGPKMRAAIGPNFR